MSCKSTNKLCKTTKNLYEAFQIRKRFVDVEAASKFNNINILNCMSVTICEGYMYIPFLQALYYVLFICLCCLGHILHAVVKLAKSRIICRFAELI
jgi:hypothetical protein